MKLLLKSFQQEAVETLYAQITDARERAGQGRLEVVTLAAPTGAGKTVIMTRLIELILQGDEDHSPDPTASFLWLTDQPELNAQTRDKMRVTSDVLAPSRIVEIGADFDYELFPPGAVYLLNTQKLGVNSTWVRKGDGRNFTLWETIRHTADAQPGRFFVVIDEAHRGTKLDANKAAEARSIMQKFVLGSEEIPPMPVVIGVSATLDRFNDLLDAAARAKKARTLQRIDIDPTDVIQSGLLKRKVILEHPEKTLGVAFPLLREGVRVWQDLTRRWEAYCTTQKEAGVVRPILLIQVEDGSKTKLSNTPLDAVIDAISSEAAGLTTNSLAHAFQEGTPFVLADGTTIRYLAPSTIDADPDVKVVLFKTSLNTGWDCPRAEVMVSFRTARDATYIAQLVGRMVRAPLARSIKQDEVLNSVSLVLPEFDQRELKKVIERLTDKTGDVPPTDVEDSRERFILERATNLDQCFALAIRLPTYIIPRKKVLTNVQRLGQLADGLTQASLRVGAGAEAREHLVDLLDGEYVQRRAREPYAQLVKLDGTIPVHPVALLYGTDSYSVGETRLVPVSDEMVAELYEWARKRLGLDLGLRYWQRRAKQDRSDTHTLTKLELYALAADPEVLQRLHAEAGVLVSTWLGEYKQKIAKLPEGERRPFDEVKHQVSKPTLDYLDLDDRETLDWSAPADAPRWPRHLYRDDAGMLPEKLNSWESAVLSEELARPGFVAWLRNRERQPWALCIPYEMGGEVKGCYPDFIVFRENGGDLVADIVDPHLVSLEDAPRKAAALAKYADEHQAQFGRIDLIIVERVGGPGTERIKRLSLMDESTRKMVLGVTTNQHLRDLFDLKS